MAVERIPSDQYNAIVNDARFRPIDEHGKKRIVFFNVPAVTVAGDALSTFDLARLPPGAVRILLAECKIQTSAWGAARLLDIGHREYSARPSGSQGAVANVAEELDALAIGIDVAAAGVKDFIGVPLKYDMYSRTGIVLAAQVRGGTVPVGATLRGYVTYVYE